MRRGEIYQASLDPTVGRELRKSRPVLIVSNDAINRVGDIVTIVPLTSNVSRVHSFEVKLPAQRTGLAKDSKVMPQQIRTISVRRLVGAKLSALDAELMADVDTALRLHLGLE